MDKRVNGPIKTCLKCGRKHISTAIAYLAESRLGYPDNFDLAIGELVCASLELLDLYPDLASRVRAERILMEEDETYMPDLVYFLREIRELLAKEESAAQLAHI